MKSILAATAALVVSGHAYADDTHWEYFGKEGPDHWGALAADFKSCAAGRRQSPIDIQHPRDVALPNIEFDYEGPAAKILNNGHTIQVDYGSGSHITVEGHTYELKQFHFHAPSENHVNGHAYPLEAHLVHKDEQGHLAVAAVFFEEGAANATLAHAWETLPEHAGEKMDLKEAVFAAELLPASREYYKFDGSLTTPPCTEDVSWFVLKQPMTASKAQIETFTRVMHHPNNRPVQALNGRAVLQ